MDQPERRIGVALGSRSYDVMVAGGLLARAGELIAPIAKGRRLAVVADRTVAALHGEALVASLTAAGLTHALIQVPPGEASKSFEGLAELTDELLALELDRGDLVVALGGGVIGDLAGFAAAIYKRGIDFVQIPTTLLAQVDSSVGGKTAIDTPRGKNLVGAFHQPRLVLADLDVLSTLPAKEIRAGYAEVLKYGLLGDAAFFDWLEANGAAVLALQPQALAHAVARSIEMKAEIVAEDEKESGARALLNLGHTFGHAFEAEIGYDKLLHGEAVALGCALAFRFSADLGLCSDAHAKRASKVIARAGLPTRIADVAPYPPRVERLLTHMAQDKKNRGGAVTLILARRIGETFVAKGVDMARLRAFLEAERCDVAP
jgi:3-dehydroquinate synthase